MQTLEVVKSDLLERCYLDRWFAHQLLFAHRHPDKSCEAHHEMVRCIYAPRPRYVIEGFRGFAKSTHLEEAAVLRAIFAEFHNMVIVGASYTRACERLEAVANELVNNEELLSLIGPPLEDAVLKGETWREGKLVLTNGVCIQALGRDQAMTGLKYLDWRPDAALIDDVEDPEEIRTDADRQQTWNWFIKVFLPSLDHPETSWVRVLGTRRGVGSLPERLENSRWPTAKFPVEYLDEEGERQATWPSKFPLATIDRMKALYSGDMHTWMQEYMCVATSEADRVFTREMFKVEPRERTWQAVYAMIDPARTTNRTSATTGWAVWSWLSNRLHVWAAGAALLKPDEIIDLFFAIHENFNPVWEGGEEDGLNEWMMQPLRQEMVKRGVTIPLKAVRAPRGKLDFIRGLNPFFAAGEVTFNTALPELEAQLLSFPTGRIDAPNALAYALTLRPAAPIYEGIGIEGLIDEMEPDPARPLYLAAHAEGSTTAALLCQSLGGQLRVYADWVEEGAPAETIPRIAAEAALEGDATHHARPRARDWTEALKLPDNRPMLRRQPLRWIIPPIHGEVWNNVGLRQAIRGVPASVTLGSDVLHGRDGLRYALARADSVRVSERAVWTLRALSGGYTRTLRRGGQLSDEAERGPYRVLMEALESFSGATAIAPDDEAVEDEQPIAINRHGVAYRSALPQGGMRR